MLNWYDCRLGIRSVDQRFIIINDRGDIKLAENTESGQKIYYCESIEDAKTKANQLTQK